jgi:hypothetical protein
MEDHLTSDLIHAFVYGLAVLRQERYQHLLDCDLCADEWSRLKQHLSEQTPLRKRCEEKAALIKAHREAIKAYSEAVSKLSTNREERDCGKLTVGGISSISVGQTVNIS